MKKGRHQVDLGSSASFSKALAPNTLMITGKQKKVNLKVSAREDGKAIDVVLEHNGEVSPYTLQPGDEFNLTHDIKIEGTLDVRPDHVFPRELKYRGETYLLNKTKNDKLILTK